MNKQTKLFNTHGAIIQALNQIEPIDLLDNPFTLLMTNQMSYRYVQKPLVMT